MVQAEALEAEYFGPSYQFKVRLDLDCFNCDSADAVIA